MSLNPVLPHSAKAQGTLLSSGFSRSPSPLAGFRSNSASPNSAQGGLKKKVKKGLTKAQAAKEATKAQAAPTKLSSLGDRPPPMDEVTKETQKWSKQDNVPGVKTSLNNKASNDNLSLPPNLSEPASPTVPPNQCQPWAGCCHRQEQEQEPNDSNLLHPVQTPQDPEKKGNPRNQTHHTQSPIRSPPPPPPPHSNNGNESQASSSSLPGPSFRPHGSTHIGHHKIPQPTQGSVPSSPAGGPSQGPTEPQSRSREKCITASSTRTSVTLGRHKGSTTGGRRQSGRNHSAGNHVGINTRVGRQRDSTEIQSRSNRSKFIRGNHSRGERGNRGCPRPEHNGRQQESGHRGSQSTGTSATLSNQHPRQTTQRKRPQ